MPKRGQAEIFIQFRVVFIAELRCT